MRKLFILTTLLCTLGVYSQDTNKIKQIDSIVNLINHSNYRVQTDTIRQDPSQVGLTMVKYLSISMNGTELKKHVTEAHMTTEDGKQYHGTSIFYFHHNALIKVDDSMIEGTTKKGALWYFADGKPIHYTVNNDRSQERAEMLLTIAKTMLEQVGSK